MKKKDKGNKKKKVMLEDDDCEFEYGSCPFCDGDLEKFDDHYWCTECDERFVVNDEGELVPGDIYVDPNEYWD